jgi:hypothetical protein
VRRSSSARAAAMWWATASRSRSSSAPWSLCASAVRAGRRHERALVQKPGRCRIADAGRARRRVGRGRGRHGGAALVRAGAGRLQARRSGCAPKASLQLRGFCEPAGRLTRARRAQLLPLRALPPLQGRRRAAVHQRAGVAARPRVRARLRRCALVRSPPRRALPLTLPPAAPPQRPLLLPPGGRVQARRRCSRALARHAASASHTHALTPRTLLSAATSWASRKWSAPWRRTRARLRPWKR